LNKNVDEIQVADVLASLELLLVSASEITAVVSHQHLPFRSEVLSKLPNLVVVSNHGVGHGHIDSEYLKHVGVPVGYTPGAASAPTAELGVGLILASARNIVQSVLKARAPETTSFDPYWYGRGVTGSTLGIIGLGDMGVRLAECMRGFDTTTLYWGRRRKASELEHRLGVHWCEGGLSELLRRSDFVVLCVASSEQTRGMMGVEEFRQMKSSAVLVNIARGDIIKQDDLVAALRSREIGGAALDVTSPEPLPRDHPLLHMENVIVTSHVGSATMEARRRMAEMCLANLMAGLEGGQLPHPVFEMPPCRSAGQQASEII